MIVVAMPIYGSRVTKQALGWLVLGRAIDSIRWRQYLNLAHVPRRSARLSARQHAVPQRRRIAGTNTGAAFSTAGSRPMACTLIPGFFWRRPSRVSSRRDRGYCAGAGARDRRSIQAEDHRAIRLFDRPRSFSRPHPTNAGRRLVPACDRLKRRSPRTTRSTGSNPRSTCARVEWPA